MTTTKKQLTREKILSAAWQLFRRQGYPDTSTRQIARKAGVADGTVFSHFPTKLDMLKAGMLTQVDQVLARARQEDNNDTPSQRLLHHAGFLYGFYADNREFSRELFKEAIWQYDYFRPQLDDFKRQLFTDPAGYNELDAEIMMDCYFMTLLHGLNRPDTSCEQMLTELEAKLTRLFHDADG
ncbi:TetR/AcrR family transcriptional regulator [Zobellella maritima]|uniref:TetR/AcrR family transcriptional regulator n=1 Tax=Zobellella maritima TaxID=2059725 RepID=UPI000E309C73|nr:TetR/AcrR family transcriptional regulator [Zobellella maritima]